MYTGPGSIVDSEADLQEHRPGSIVDSEADLQEHRTWQYSGQ